MARPRGFVLLNALVLVIAVASISAAVLTLAAKGRARLFAAQVDAQLSLYLDAAEALIPTLLQAEWEEGGVDHLGEAWAGTGLRVPIGRGVVGAGLTDLQGRLNVNLLNLGDDRARAEFARLFDALGLPPALLLAVEGFVAEGGPPNVAGYLSRSLPILPRGGALRLTDELRRVAGMTPERFARLSPFVAALPFEAALNANTAPAEVLQAVMPELGARGIRRILDARAATPFESALDFRLRMAALFGEDALQSLPLERFTARSSHFAATVTAELEGRILRRRAIFVRDDSDDGRTRRSHSLAVPDTLPAPGAP